MFRTQACAYIYSLENIDTHSVKTVCLNYYKKNVVICSTDIGALVANPDFREVMTSYQHLSMDPENICPHKTSLKKE